MGGGGCRLAQDCAHADRQLQLIPTEQGGHGQLVGETTAPVRDAGGAGRSRPAPATQETRGALAHTQSLLQNAPALLLPSMEA